MFIKGSRSKIIGIILHERFVGLNFVQCARTIFNTTGDHLLAVQKEGQILVFPKDYVIKSIGRGVPLEYKQPLCTSCGTASGR